MGNFFDNKSIEATGLDESYKLLSHKHIDIATISCIKISKELYKLISQHPNLQKITISTVYGNYLNHIILNTNLLEVYIRVQKMTREEMLYLFENIKYSEVYRIGLNICNVTEEVISVLSESLVYLGVTYDIHEDIIDNNLDTIITISENSPTFTYNILEKK